MNYELAKKLKEAGFPQGEWASHKEQTPKGYRTTHYYEIYIPTLSELIESCNPLKADDFGLILRGDKWEAYFLYVGYFEGFPKKYTDEEGFANVDIRQNGSTPEEAVANLWLALNKKS